MYWLKYIYLYNMKHTDNPVYTTYIQTTHFLRMSVQMAIHWINIYQINRAVVLQRGGGIHWNLLKLSNNWTVCYFIFHIYIYKLGTLSAFYLDAYTLEQVIIKMIISFMTWMESNIYDYQITSQINLRGGRALFTLFLLITWQFILE